MTNINLHKVADIMNEGTWNYTGTGNIGNTITALRMHTFSIRDVIGINPEGTPSDEWEFARSIADKVARDITGFEGNGQIEIH